MARKTNKSDLAPVLAAAKHWIDRCLVGDQSLFFDEVLWTEANAAELQQHFVENPDESDLSFLNKLPNQLAAATPAAQQLMAEIFWAIRLFPTTPKAPTKRAQFLQVWQLCGRPLVHEHPMLSSAALDGIGSAGTAYLTGPWREIAFLIKALLQLKLLSREERAALFASNDKLSPWLEALVEKGERQFTHILRYFAFPDTIERISSGPEKKKILRGFGVPFSNSWTALQVDQALLELRHKQEAEHPGLVLDFYDPPLDTKWKKPKAPKGDAEAEDDADDVEPNDVLEEPSPSPTEPDQATNRIFYGPPGTGKTHRLRELFPRYTETPAAKNRDAWLEALVAGCGWREVIAAALSQLGPSAVPALRNQELIRAKARQRSTDKNLGARLWGTLQRHTPLNVQTVNFGLRAEPFIFSKDEESTWSLLLDWTVRDEEASKLATDYLAGQKSAPPVKRYRAVTFHPSYCYEDFVRGIRPVSTEEDGRTEFRLVDGVFKQICDEARANPTKRYALFIDEINRGNIAKIFGELITLIEPDKRITVAPDGTVTGGMTVQLPGSNTGEVAEPPFGVPANLDLYGTMNTADRSIALLDIALRRRFEFVEMPPLTNATVFPASVDGVDRGALLRRINDRLEYLLDRDHRIGHAYLMKAKSLADLRSAFANQIIPLLQEYFFDDLGKVALVLTGANGRSEFVEKKDLRHADLFPGDTSRNTTASRHRYEVTPPGTWTAEHFQEIYATATAVEDTEDEAAS
ncbi:MAG: AAA family ATPase [Verrucomicrobia bacterium]|nr:AAA family ATPase [Verrucomicrobiota bacterium]